MSALISLTEVTKTFGTTSLFESISLVISEGDRTALIGPNGAGKSTLFRVIAGLSEVDSGNISRSKGLQMAYVPQVEQLDESLTVEDVLRNSLDSHALDIEARISKYAGRAGFSDRSQSVSELSGGWKKRLSIASALIKEPELLLLDEPTNHLDIDSILWLEEIVLELRCAVVFVSHDRYFIEQVAKRVIELDRVYPKGFLASDGPYSDFLETRDAFLSQQRSYRESLRNKVRNEVAWLRRGAKARTTKAKGRIQGAHRLIEELEGIKLERKKIDFEFSESGRKTKDLVHLEKVGKSLAGKELFKDLTFTIKPGIRLGIVGANGAGKTTLLKTVLSEIPPDSGSIRTAPRLSTAYLDQKRIIIDPSQSLKRALCPEGDAVVFNGRELHVTTWAQKFLFHTDQLSLPISALSGGERARVLLAKHMLLPADLLVLDEPTNDLDIATLEVLEEILCEFAGAIILVTHDRHMLDRVCTHVIGLSGNGRCSIYADYTQWEIDRETSQPEIAARAPTKERIKSTPEGLPKLTYAERIELGKITNLISKAEEIVTGLHAEISSPEKSSDSSWLIAKCDELALAEKKVQGLYQRWEELEAKKIASKE